MTAHFPGLANGAGNGTRSPGGYPSADLLRHPGDAITKAIVPFDKLTMEVRKFLGLQVSPVTRDSAPRTLVLQGPPGSGKSDGALVAALLQGFTVAVVSASALAGENEGSAPEVLNAYLEQFSR